MRTRRGDKLDELLARNDSSKGWRTIYDEYNDREITLSREEVRLILRIRQAQFPHAEVFCLLAAVIRSVQQPAICKHT